MAVQGVSQATYTPPPLKVNSTLITALALTVIGAVVAVLSPLAGLIAAPIASLAVLAVGGVILTAGIVVNFFVSFKKPELEGEWSKDGKTLLLILREGEQKNVDVELVDGEVKVTLDDRGFTLTNVPHYKHLVHEQDQFVFKKENFKDWISQFKKVTCGKENAGDTIRLELRFE